MHPQLILRQTARPAKSPAGSLASAAAEFVEIIDNVLPFEVAVTACRQAIKQLLSQQHSQKAAEYVSTDGLVGFVEDRPRGEQRLGGFKGVLDGQQVTIAQDDLQG